MEHASQATKHEDRLSIRASIDQKSVLRRAAEARHTTVSQFVLEASLNEADRILAQEKSLAVPSEEFEWLCELMDHPSRDLSELKALVDQKPAWNV